MKASDVFKDSDNPKENLLVCPVCGFDYQHEGNPRRIKGNDKYEDDWWGRGDLIVIPFYGECGTSWELCLGFHKGQIHCFTRITELNCKKDQGREVDHV